MQTVNVADIKVKTGTVKSGAKEGEPWELIIIIGDDGSEFTTFDRKAKEVGIGGVIELEPVLKGGKVNFTKFTITKRGQAQAPGPTSTGFTNGDSPEKRKSIEDQTRAERITELWIAGKLTDEDILVSKLRDWLEKLGAAVAEKKPESAKATSEKQTTEPGHFENAGQFMAAVQKDFGMNQEAVKTRFGCAAKDIADLDTAWADLIAGKTTAPEDISF